MPNNIDINLSIMGKDQLLGEFTRQAQGKRKLTGDLPTFPDGRKNINYTDPKDNTETVFEFNQLVPLPESYSQFPYSDHGYDLEAETWGIKWGAYGHKQPKFEEGQATYWFRCAWEAPRYFLKQVSAKWPDLWFVVSYGGEGPVRGRFALHNGEFLDNVANNTGPSFGDISDEEWEEQHEAWVNACRNVHEDYTRYVLLTYILQQVEQRDC